ncbi:MAG TPA: hypothetical protein PK252_08955 [Bacteroidales bacterium]|nr:hypothetical protein [Bacteroidales bacterium]
MNITEWIIIISFFIIVSGTNIYLVWLFLRNAEKNRKVELLLKTHEMMMPLRLQAYERLILFLERISIDMLLTRHSRSGITSRQLHTELLSSIRKEFEHNISQQLYVSAKAWEMIKNARAEIVKIINLAAESTDPKAPGIDLSKKILEDISNIDKLPLQKAIDYIKQEAKEIF